MRSVQIDVDLPEPLCLNLSSLLQHIHYSPADVVHSELAHGMDVDLNKVSENIPPFGFVQWFVVVIIFPPSLDYDHWDCHPPILR